MKYVESVGIITYTIQNDSIQYLLLLSDTGCWDFPKGHIESGETKRETALRELQEETGLTAQLDDTFEQSLSYVYPGYQNKQETHKTDYMFVGKAFRTTITLSPEHTDYAWLTYDQALKQITYDDTRELFKKAHEYITSHAL